MPPPFFLLSLLFLFSSFLAEVGGGVGAGFGGGVGAGFGGGGFSALAGAGVGFFLATVFADLEPPSEPSL